MLNTLAGLEERNAAFGDPQGPEDVHLDLLLDLAPGLPLVLAADADAGVVHQSVET